MGDTDRPIGPAGGCAQCYRWPCICNETPEQRARRNEREALRTLRCDACGLPSVVPDYVTRAFVCLDCGSRQAQR